jgi:SAM-dependent methyltransferase
MLKKFLKKIIPYKIYYPITSSYRKISSKKYQGKGFLCPFCETEFNTFFEFGFDNEAIRRHNIVGAGINKNGTCPSCRSNDRERHVFLYLQKYHSSLFVDQYKLLHIAPEKNLWELFIKKKNIEYTAAGFDMQLASVKMDITKIPQKNDYYDVIICNHVLEHIIDDKSAMLELFRVLKKGGFAILQVPISFDNRDTIEDKSVIDPNERREIFGQSDHVRIYGRDYLARLKDIGFMVETFEAKEEFNQNDLVKYSLIQNEKIFVCFK